MDLDEKELARLLGLLRVVFGCALFLAPNRSARGWTGESAHEVTPTLALRGMGARDIALGTGLLVALEHGGPARGWLEAGAMADAADAFATLTRWRSMPWWRSAFWFASEVGAALLGARLAQEVD